MVFDQHGEEWRLVFYYILCLKWGFIFFHSISNMYEMGLSYPELSCSLPWERDLSGLLHLVSFADSGHIGVSQEEGEVGAWKAGERTRYFPALFPCFSLTLGLWLYPSISEALAGGPSCRDLALTGIWNHYSLPLPFQLYGVHGFPLLLVSKCLSVPPSLVTYPACASILVSSPPSSFPCCGFCFLLWPWTL